MNNNRCVVCNEIIPEGRQVCPNCEKREYASVEESKRLVFICSPYTAPTRRGFRKNIENTKRFCRLAYEKGYIPFAPHLFFPAFLNESNPTERAAGIELGKQIMEKCDEVWVFGNTVTGGMSEEIEFARKNYIPVIYRSET